MSDIGFDPNDYNNGVPPRDGMVWVDDDVEGQDHWGWPTQGSQDGDTLTVTPVPQPGGGGGMTPQESVALAHATYERAQESYERQKAWREKQAADTAARQATLQSMVDSINAKVGKDSAIRLQDIHSKDKAWMQQVQDKAKHDLQAAGDMAAAAKAAERLRKQL